VPDLEAFRNKCDRTGVHRAIIVSATGFAKTALKKAEAMEIGCLGLEEVSQFNWCRAPAIEYYERNLLPGPEWQIDTATPFRGTPQIYDRTGTKLDEAGFSNIAQSCLSQRQPDIAKRQDDEARTTPVLCTFVNEVPSAFYLIDNNGQRIPLTRMVINVLYEAKYSLIPLSFHDYIDYAKGRSVANAAIARIEHGGLKGDFVLQRDEPTGIVKITFISPSP
jgi:hypothetical protein